MPARTIQAMSRHVLVVDDDLAIRRAIALLLEDERYAVVTAANGLEALDRITEERPAVVLLDLQMPVLSGWEVLRHLQAQESDIPVVVMTAGHLAPVEARTHQAAGFLAKPFAIEDVLAVVERFTTPDSPPEVWGTAWP